MTSDELLSALRSLCNDAGEYGREWRDSGQSGSGILFEFERQLGVIVYKLEQRAAMSYVNRRNMMVDLVQRKESQC